MARARRRPFGWRTCRGRWVLILILILISCGVFVVWVKMIMTTMTTNDDDDDPSMTTLTCARPPPPPPPGYQSGGCHHGEGRREFPGRPAVFVLGSAGQRVLHQDDESGRWVLTMISTTDPPARRVSPRPIPPSVGRGDTHPWCFTGFVWLG